MAVKIRYADGTEEIYSDHTLENVEIPKNVESLIINYNGTKKHQPFEYDLEEND